LLGPAADLPWLPAANHSNPPRMVAFGGLSGRLLALIVLPAVAGCLCLDEWVAVPAI
jgi:hypothetical protein